jgi:hypothetical protein
MAMNLTRVLHLLASGAVLCAAVACGNVDDGEGESVQGAGEAERADGRYCERAVGMFGWRQPEPPSDTADKKKGQKTPSAPTATCPAPVKSTPTPPGPSAGKPTASNPPAGQDPKTILINAGAPAFIP